MRILLTGASGYIGKRLLPVLLQQGHEVICCVRDKKRFPDDGIYNNPNVSLFEIDFLKDLPSASTIENIDVAYYLIHSMSSVSTDFDTLEELSVNNFIKLLKSTYVKQIIYLGGITNEKELSKHLASRKRVNDILHHSGLTVTSLQAGIIVGSGSSSFEIIRDLVEKLPVMVAPKWLTTKCQPIAIRNVIEFLTGVLLREETYNKSYDIGGPDVLTYKEMLLQFAKVRGLKRYIFTVPVMTPRLSSYWLYFITSTSYTLATNLVNSMKVEVIAKNNDLQKMLGILPLSYQDAVKMAFQKIEQNNVISSWKDALVSSYNDNTLLEHIHVPSDGCYKDIKLIPVVQSVHQVLENIWSIGGERGWYYCNWLWNIRGFLDKLFGGVGLRRGRTNVNTINTGDTLDFWRVLAADKQNKRLLLYAEMKLPGEAWLEFKLIHKNNKDFLVQSATFRPKGLPGRLYWYAMFPFHIFIFKGMAAKICSYKTITPPKLF
jgi:uncharacterized protein YbjT (DUF2867 family)